MSLNDALDEVLAEEGGYSNISGDNGGETNFGITVAVARAFGYSGSMDSMSLDQAKKIYTQRYWLQPRYDQVDLISEQISEKLFDIGVNMGTVTASGFLQRSLNVLNNADSFYPNIVADGNIGAITISALKSYFNNRGSQGVETLLKMINALQSVRYIEIAEKNPSQEKFEYGWQTNRVN